MAGNSNDDLAKALANLSHDEPDAHGHAEADHASPQPTPAQQQRPARPGTPVQRPATPLASTAAVAPAAVPQPQRQLQTRRTLIPILLTLGATLALGGLLCMVLGEESPVEGLILPLLMLLLGILIVGVAAVTMMQVRHALSGGAKR